MIKIISKKKYRRMVKDLTQYEELKGAHLNLHELYKGVVNKSIYEKGLFEETLKEREEEIESLKKKLRKAEHEKSETIKKLLKYEARRK